MSNHQSQPTSIICYGELVVDIFGSLQKGLLPKFGGAPGNTAIGLKKLGHPSVYFTGKVGADFFGNFLEDTLKKYNVQTNYLFRDKEYKTTLAFVASGPKGERDFSFYAGAHALINQTEIKKLPFKKTKLIQFGSLTQTNPICQKATAALIKRAQKEKVFLSYDPNIRLPLWPNQALLKKTILNTLPHVNSLKVSQEELYLLSGTTDFKKAVQKLWHPNFDLMLVTLGSKGAFWKSQKKEGRVPGKKVKAVDTTGAGDAFNAALIFQLEKFIQAGRLEASPQEIKRAVAFANNFAAKSTLKKGAI